MQSLGDLRPDPKNAREHSPRNIGMLVDALQEVGAARSIVIDEDGVILAGNGVYEAAAQAGIERVQIVDVDGETLVAVRRSNLTEEQKTRLALFDNRVAELASWDAGELAGVAGDGLLAGLFYDWEVEKILGNIEDRPIDRMAEWEGMPDFENEKASGFHELTLHFATEQDMQSFAELVGQPVSIKTRYLWIPALEWEPMLANAAHDES